MQVSIIIRLDLFSVQVIFNRNGSHMLFDDETLKVARPFKLLQNCICWFIVQIQIRCFHRHCSLKRLIIKIDGSTDVTIYNQMDLGARVLDTEKMVTSNFRKATNISLKLFVQTHHICGRFCRSKISCRCELYSETSDTGSTTATMAIPVEPSEGIYFFAVRRTDSF